MRRYIPFGPMRPDASDYDLPDLEEARNVLPLYSSYWSLRKEQVVSEIDDATPPTSPDGVSGITGSIAHFYTAPRVLKRIGLIQDTITGAGWRRFGTVSEDDDSLYLQIDDGATPDDETGILFQIPEGAFTPGGVFARVKSGLIFRDDFNRADSGDVGSPWAEEEPDVGDVSIASNRLSLNNISSATAPAGATAEGTGEASTEGFLQMVADNPTSRKPVLGFYSGDKRGYGNATNAFNGEIDLTRFDGSADETGTQIGGGNVGVGVGDATYQFYSAPGVQEGTYEGSGFASSDTTYDSVEKFGAVRNITRSGGSGGVSTHNDFLWMASKSVVVSGLDTGWKAKILDALDAVVAEATESSGVATVDASSFGGATEAVPYDGWASIIVTDAADMEIKRYDAEGVYPGDEYVFFSNPNADGRATYEALFEAIVDPGIDDDHTLTYRYRFNGKPLQGEDPFLGSLTLEVYLYEGSTELGLIASHGTTEPDDEWVPNSVEIPSPIIAAISDYTDLRVRFFAEVIADAATEKLPNEDLATSGSWVNESGDSDDLFESVNETVDDPNVDDTFIESPEVGPGGVARYRAGLEDGESPDTFEGFHLTARAEASEPGVEIRLQLLENGVQIAGRSFTDIPTVFTDHVFDIDPSNIMEIQDFGSLEAQVVVRASGGGSSGLLSLAPTAFTGSKVDTQGTATDLRQENSQFVVSAANQNDGGRFRVLLESGADPGTNEGHQIRIIGHHSGSGVNGTSVQLFQGGSVIYDSRDQDGSSGKSLPNPPGSELVFGIPASVAANITSYGSLVVQVLTHEAASTGGGQANYDLLALEIPGGKSAKISAIQLSYPSRAWVGVSYNQLALPDSQAGEIGDVTEIYAGTYESIYEVDESGWTDVSKTGHYGQAESPRSWHFAPFGSNLFATNKADPVQVRAPADADFSDLITSTAKPRAATIATCHNHVVLANIDYTGPPGPDGSPDEWWCSAFDDPTDFDVDLATGANRRRTQETPGEIVKATGGEFVLLFKRNSIHRLDFVAGEQSFRASVVSHSDGTRYTRSVIQDGRDVYFYDSSGFKVVRNGSVVEPVDLRGDITRLVTDAEFEAFAPRPIPTDREALKDTAVIGDRDPVTGILWWAIRGRESSIPGVNEPWFNNSLVLYNPKEQRWTVARVATLGENPLSVSAVIGLPAAKQSSETITRGIGFIRMGENFDPNFHAQYIRLINERTYESRFETKILSTKLLGGGSFEGFVKKLRPVYRLTTDALARPDVKVTVQWADDPLMQFDLKTDPVSRSETDPDGWYPVQAMGEFFRFIVEIPEMTRQTIREITGLEFDIEESGEY